MFESLGRCGLSAVMTFELKLEIFQWISFANSSKKNVLDSGIKVQEPIHRKVWCDETVFTRFLWKQYLTPQDLSFIK